MIPRDRDIEIPLLQALEELGGTATKADVVALVTKAFPDLTEADLTERLSSGAKKWENRIAWVRLSLVEKGEVGKAAHGIWQLTDKGRIRLKTASGATVKPVVITPTPTLESLVNQYQQGFRDQLLTRLLDMTPAQFETFAKRLLEVYGFEEMKVTQISHDGGIDGHGRLRVGLATMKVAVQCKRWKGSVGRPEIDAFRGAIQGEYEQGLFFTTADFTAGARDVSIKRGAVPIVLINGPMIVNLMIEKGFGVNRRPLELYDDRMDEILTEPEES